MSIGLIAYKILTGHLPEWPFEWPPAGYATLRRKAHPELIAVIRRALELRPSRRYRDANDLLRAFKVVKAKSLKFAHRHRATTNGKGSNGKSTNSKHA